MLSFRQLRRNVGVWGLVRLVFVVLVISGIAAVFLARFWSPWPLLGVLAAVALVTALRHRVVEHPEQSSKVLRWLGYGMVAGAATSVWWRRWTSAESIPVLTGLCFVAMVYGAWFFVLFADHRVERR